ncbi:ImmA/IrrE family metallo-endopeptidase [Laribacter hongkongensis]|uniref:Putative Zn peptidase n=1 Tax=Laribacter hongkongensis TaxID=168471 RepID=A0A248LMV3_9NEIS|nr:ImmA/IrrE family metallo-endopeptidase [Laribacter hongkongensis]ASJ25811.1 putative Zn peptidase [Laribacter hongkongensis]MCG9102715.1 ImmA/IrrE family metallo-endopeptidase [Laribacter hongkongensis]MCG9109555.1 ImmA/IrrE family metallo-endopeptidase [Laribacter hongkongensis]MCG9113199.1 ImmA/IrrE family metallo-endopeptidase [Laribacter hongkongensis]
MSSTQALTGSIAASHVHKWLRAWYGSDVPEAVDLDVVRRMLPTTPYGKGVREIRPPVQFNDNAFEGMLARDSTDPALWGIAYNGTVSPERQRFTIAHELGHFILHRDQRQSFNCDKESVYSGADTIRVIEREADDFASNLLMPGDLLREWISNQRIDLHVLSALAKRFQVSFEALCIRFIKFTTQRAILVYWDNGFVKYEWRSSSAVKTRARIRRTDDPQEPLTGTLAADSTVEQEWDGTEMSAAIWCPEEAPHMKLREFKHSYTTGDRVLTLLLLESAEPRSWDRSWQDGESFDSYDQFVANGQRPVR